MRAMAVLLMLAAGAGLARPAGAVAIPMPTGSTVWLHFGAAVCADGTTAVGNADCIASNQPGPNPPNGIPSTTFTSGPSSVSIYAELLPDRVRSHLVSENPTGAAFLYASFLDTYTVHGMAAGPFDITVHLSADGTAYSRPIGSDHMLSGQGVNLEIGTWNPVDTPILEQFRVTPTFAAGGWGGSTIVQGVPFSVPIAATTSYTLSTSAGSQFDLAYGVNVNLIRGELDLLSTATIWFDLPPGVWLTSLLGGTFGDVPEPAAGAITALGLGLAACARRARGSPRRPARAPHCVVP